MVDSIIFKCRFIKIAFVFLFVFFLGLVIIFYYYYFKVSVRWSGVVFMFRVFKMIFIVDFRFVCFVEFVLFIFFTRLGKGFRFFIFLRFGVVSCGFAL